MKYISIAIICLFFSCNNTTEVDKNKIESKIESLNEIIIERWAPTDYRNENWHPEKGRYFFSEQWTWTYICLLYTSPSPRDRQKSRMPSSA